MLRKMDIDELQYSFNGALSAALDKGHVQLMEPVLDAVEHANNHLVEMDRAIEVATYWRHFEVLILFT